MYQAANNREEIFKLKETAESYLLQTFLSFGALSHARNHNNDPERQQWFDDTIKGQTADAYRYLHLYSANIESLLHAGKISQEDYERLRNVLWFDAKNFS